MRGAPEPGRRYRLYGEVFAVDEGIVLHAPTTDQPSTGSIWLVTDPPGAEWDSATEMSSTPVQSGRTEPDFRFFRLPDRDVIRASGSADYHLLDDGVVCHLTNPAHHFLIEIMLNGMVLAFWLERRGVLTLHGSAVSLDGAGVGFLANRGTGKSSLVAHLTARNDPLVTEDLLAVRWDDGEPLAQPGLAHLRLWPDQASRFVEDWESLERPHPGFTKRRIVVGEGGIGGLVAEPPPLRRLYVLDRRESSDDDVEILDLPGTVALAHLLRNSYLPELGERFGWQERRLGQLAQLLTRTPVRVLRYPSGLERLDEVREAIVADLDRSG